MKDQLPAQPNKNIETGIINLDNSTGSGNQWVAYAIYPRGNVCFDSYGLAPPNECMRYMKRIKIPTLYSTLPTEHLNDPSICGNEVLSVIDAISSSKTRPHQIINEYTSGSFKNRRF